MAANGCMGPTFMNNALAKIITTTKVDRWHWAGGLFNE